VDRVDQQQRRQRHGDVVRVANASQEWNGRVADPLLHVHSLVDGSVAAPHLPLPPARSSSPPSSSSSTSK
jgi:hypothetical protein